MAAKPPPGPPTVAAASSPPPAPKPRVPLELADAPTQRLYLFAAFLLLQALKVADLVAPAAPNGAGTSSAPTSLLLDLLNSSRLLKWIAIDLFAIQVVSWLRVPRFDWGWKALWLGRIAMVLLNWLCFGSWTFSASMLLPTFLKSLFVSYVSTGERSTRLSKVLGNEQSHLGGQYTVHILAVSTALLNPISTCYCLSSAPKPEPILIPLILNNTAPSKLTYTLTSFADPPTSQLITVPSSALVRPSHAAPTSEHHEDDDLPSWAVVPAASSAPRHRIPSAGRDPSDPFDLSPSESLYYLPVTATGSVRLESVLDADGVPVRIRRKRGAEGWEETKIVRCPRAGFELKESKKEAHRCLAGVAPESWSLELAVSGQEPLNVKWHSKEGDSPRRKADGLEGIVGGAATVKDGIVRVPMNVSLTRAGRTTYFLDSVVDGCGNEVSFAGQSSSDSTSDSTGNKQAVVLSLGKNSKKARPVLPGMVDSRSVVVHRPPEIAFSGSCGRGEDVKLLQGKSTALEIRLSSVEQEIEEERRRLRSGGKKDEELWTVTVKYTPESGKPTTRDVQTSISTVRLDVQEAGAYEIVNVKSKWCAGVVLVPSTCNVVLQPYPTLLTTFESLYDVCKSEIGLVSTLHFTGVPPFTVHYDLIEHGRGKPRTTRQKKRINSSREEIRIEPGPGEWETRFVQLEDKWYNNVKLPAEARYARKQKVQLVGDAQWRNAKQKRVVHSCEGETISVEVELKGTAPWDLEYAVVGQPKQVITGIKSTPHSIDIDIPSPIAARGGQFFLSLESIKDGNGCKRPLTTATDLTVEVQRTKPTARFHGLEGARSVVIRENDSAKIPVRLTGNGPWTIRYQPPPHPSRPNELPPAQEVVAQNHNVDITLSNPRAGVYTLLSVRDEFCPGDVTETDWTISTLPRPSLRVEEKAGSVARNGSIIRKAVCEDAVDSVAFAFDGKAPFKASYTLAKGSQPAERHQLASIQSRADLTLYTGSAGHHTYQFSGVGDSLYTDPDAAGLVAPTGGRRGLLRLEQDVFSLPSASFLHGPKHGFCVNDPLASRSGDDLILKLEGQAPFEVEIEVREEGHRTPKTFTIPNISTKEWPLVLPLDLHTPSSHSISIRRVQDANGCIRLVDSTVTKGAARTSLVVPVAEIASIAPVLPSLDACVGDFLEYVVQGAPPFTVKYSFEGKERSVPLQTGKFTRLAAEPGLFKIVSVGHGQDQCKSNEVNLMKRIHPIPTASVQQGDSYVVDIREGDQTEIIFAFTGTPPFAFTYSRRKPQDRSKDKTVLETHTVTGIEASSYSIFTSQEGTWSVSYIADAHCSYPPRQADGAGSRLLKN